MKYASGMIIFLWLSLYQVLIGEGRADYMTAYFWLVKKGS
jgi:hypothetical protein